MPVSAAALGAADARVEKPRRSGKAIQPGLLRHLASRHYLNQPLVGVSRIPLLDRTRRNASTNGLSVEVHSASPSASPTTLQRVASGDAGAMEDCIREFGGLVWTLVTRRVADPTTAEDLTQEIFTEIWKNSGRYDPSKGSEATFVGLIARRRALDWLRKKERQPDFQPLPDDLDARIPQSAEPADSSYDIEQVRQAVDGLPEETRKLFSLHFDQGMSHDEIARNTGMALGSVKTRLRRGLIEARANLRRLLSRSAPSTAVGDSATR